MSGLVDQILGRKPVAEDCSVPPVLAARPRQPVGNRRELPPEGAEADDESSEAEEKAEQELQKRARRSSVVGSILGMTESEGTPNEAPGDESIIPDDAQAADTFNTSQIPGVKNNPLGKTQAEPEEPAFTAREELIQPSAALVAPDLTPNVMQLIDPAQVPAPPQAAERPVPPPSVAAAQAAGAMDAAGVMNTILARQNARPQPQAPSQSPEELRAAAESMVAQMTNPENTAERVMEAVIPANAGGPGMPLHREGDGRTIFNTFRRFAKP